jgi:glutathione S-transferase
MKLYYFETPNTRKPCAVAKYLGSPVEFVLLDPAKQEHKTPEFLAINPNGKVPALEDGDTKLWESSAIMCYLAHKAESDLWPRDERQVDIIRWFSWDTAHFSRHAGTLFFQYVVKPFIGAGDPDAAVVEEATKFFKQFAGVLNDYLSGRKYLVDDRLTLADFAVAAFLPYADEARIPLDGFTDIQRWHRRLNELQAWRQPFPLQRPQ